MDHNGLVRCRSLRVTTNSKIRRGFATADAFNDNTPLDELGYPCFQGTRGIRCRIHGIHDHRLRDGSDMMTAFSDLTPEQRQRKKKSLLTKVGIGLAAVGAVALFAVGTVAITLPPLSLTSHPSLFRSSLGPC